jgi:hypothetical protein
MTCDGHVDRWDRDAQLMAQEEAQAGVEIADAGAANGSAPMTVGANGQVTDGGVDAGKKKAKK